MALAAVVDGVRVVPARLSERQWDELVIRLRVDESVARLKCGHEAFGRVRHLGTRHFVHHSEVDCKHPGAPMTPEHLRIQELAHEACIKAGWQASMEFTLGDRIADVTTTRDNERAT